MIFLVSEIFVLYLQIFNVNKCCIEIRKRQKKMNFFFPENLKKMYGSAICGNKQYFISRNKVNQSKALM